MPQKHHTNKVKKKSQVWCVGTTTFILVLIFRVIFKQHSENCCIMCTRTTTRKKKALLQHQIQPNRITLRKKSCFYFVLSFFFTIFSRSFLIIVMFFSVSLQVILTNKVKVDEETERDPVERFKSFMTKTTEK